MVEIVKDGIVEIRFNLRDPVENKLYYILAEHTMSKISHVVIEALKNYLLYNKDDVNKKLLDIVNNLTNLLVNGGISQQSQQIVVSSEPQIDVKKAEKILLDQPKEKKINKNIDNKNQNIVVSKEKKNTAKIFNNKVDVENLDIDNLNLKHLGGGSELEPSGDEILESCFNNSFI